MAPCPVWRNKRLQRLRAHWRHLQTHPGAYGQVAELAPVSTVALKCPIVNEPGMHSIAERSQLCFTNSARFLVAMSRQRSKKARLRRLRIDSAGADLQRQCPQTSQPNAGKLLTSRRVSAPSYSLLLHAVYHLDWAGLLQTLVETASGLLDLLGPAPGTRGRDTLTPSATQRPVVAAAAWRADGEGLRTWHTLNGHLERVAHFWVETCIAGMMLALTTTVQHECCYAPETYITSEVYTLGLPLSNM